MPERIEEDLAHINALKKDGDIARIKTFCRSRLRGWETDHHYHMILTAMYRDFRMYEEALRYLAELEMPAHLRPHYERISGTILIRMLRECQAYTLNGRWASRYNGRRDDALEHYRVLSAFFPKHPDVVQLGNVLRTLGQLPKSAGRPAELRRDRVCLVTSYDDNYAPIGALAARTIVRYAETYGYDHRIITNYSCGRSPLWDKIKIIQDLMEEGYEYVFWVDADAMFVRYDVDIATVVDDEHDLYMVNVRTIRIECPGSYIVHDAPNTGVMLVRNTPWSKRLLATVWQQEEFVGHPIEDNAAFVYVLGYYRTLEIHKTNELNVEFTDRIKFIDHDWNGHPLDWTGSSPVILHYAGRPFCERVAGMQEAFDATFPKG